jgi:hypothetical protein
MTKFAFFWVIVALGTMPAGARPWREFLKKEP